MQNTVPEWVYEEDWDEVFRMITDHTSDLKRVIKQLLDLEIELERIYNLKR